MKEECSKSLIKCRENISESLKNIIEIMKKSAVMLLIFIGSILLVSGILFICHISISIANVVISLISTALISWRLYKNTEKYKIIAAAIIAVVVFTSAILFSMRTYDVSWDGNTYHKLAVGMLKDGWNPVYQNAESFINEDPTGVGIVDDGDNSVWIEHYPKASWIYAASIYACTNNIESGKMLCMLMVYIIFALSIEYLYKKMNICFAIVISIFIALNPISNVQLFNFYIDGIMGICIYTILYALLSISEKSNDESKVENYWILAISIMISINLKFTGLVYAAAFCFMFFVLAMYKAQKEKKLAEALKKMIAFYFVVVSISIGIVGYSSYVKNTIFKGNPLYPLMGENKRDIITLNQPVNFKQKGPLEKFYISMFGVASNVNAKETIEVPKLKIPFSIKKGETANFIKPDTRISGFGVWFSGVFIISLCVIVAYIVKYIREKRYDELSKIIAFIITSFVLVIITDGSWWARYVPYIYLLPILAITLLAERKSSMVSSMVSNVVAVIVCAILFLNNNSIFCHNLRINVELAKIVRVHENIMQEINENEGKVEIALTKKDFASSLYNLRDKGLNVEVKDEVATETEWKLVNRIYYKKQK